jgi:hypothetical protein
VASLLWSWSARDISYLVGLGIAVVLLLFTVGRKARNRGNGSD